MKQQRRNGMKKILFAILLLSVLSAAAFAEEKLLVGEGTSVGIYGGPAFKN
jgi:hypothetical protein